MEYRLGVALYGILFLVAWFLHVISILRSSNLKLVINDPLLLSHSCYTKDSPRPFVAFQDPDFQYSPDFL